MDELDRLLAGAKSIAMQPSDALMARVLADAEAVRAEAVRAEAVRMAAGPAVPAVVRQGVFSWLAEIFGGAGALAGMGTAAAAGLFIGFAQPSAFSSVTELASGGSIASVELLPDVDALLAGE